MRVCAFVLFLSWVSSCVAQDGCDCFPVKTTNTDLNDLIRDSPLYSQAASNVTNLNSICITLTAVNTPDNALVEMVIIYSNSTVVQRASIQKPIEPGQFLIAGPARTYKDFIIGNPCPQTYVIYRCVQTGRCLTDFTRADVIVVSSRFRESKSCIEKGLDIARETFPDIQKYYYLPRKSVPCCQKAILFSS
ncbi:uncharacterized protein LOC124369744 [Homalodisca vitripennis]|uniref:uncharacterized protein LOC124369744 n=1 Tax=Homalodisca vitripennis TaxID=197043 RepID=UPI001EEBBA64|nr:uncharacterized protein LOC124369744 [Homalodisca vitripennis]